MHTGSTAMAMEIAALKARIAEIERDAARYRWLRSAQPYVTPGCDNGDLIPTLSGEDLDAGIDAALSLGKGDSNE